MLSVELGIFLFLLICCRTISETQLQSYSAFHFCLNLPVQMCVLFLNTFLSLPQKARTPGSLTPLSNFSLSLLTPLMSKASQGQRPFSQGLCNLQFHSEVCVSLKKSLKNTTSQIGIKTLTSHFFRRKENSKGNTLHEINTSYHLSYTITSSQQVAGSWLHGCFF